MVWLFLWSETHVRMAAGLRDLSHVTTSSVRFALFGGFHLLTDHQSDRISAGSVVSVCNVSELANYPMLIGACYNAFRTMFYCYAILRKLENKYFFSYILKPN